MEFAQSGDLYAETIRCSKEGIFADEDWIWRIFIQLVKGLKVLHSLKILHRDLKSANVFLSDEKQIAKLGDLNVSKVAKKGLLYTQTGTPYYSSPEIWRDLPYDHKSDIWSLGCVLYEIAALKPPFRAETMEGLYKKIMAGKYPRIPSIYSSDLSKLIRSLLQVQPHMRPNCDKILDIHFIHAKVIRYFPEDISKNAAQNILLRTIVMPKNMLYLTDQLPSANYDSSLRNNKELKLPDAIKKKNAVQTQRHDPSKRFSSVQRGFLPSKKENQKDLNHSEVMRPLNKIQSDQSESEEDYESQYEEDEEYIPNSKLKKIQITQPDTNIKLDSKQLIAKIIDTTKDIDKELDRKEYIENLQDYPFQRKKSAISQAPQIDNSQPERKPKRVIMNEGVYDRQTQLEQSPYDILLQKNVYNPGNSQNETVFSGRSLSQVQNKHQEYS